MKYFIAFLKYSWYYFNQGVFMLFSEVDLEYCSLPDRQQDEVMFRRTEIERLEHEACQALLELQKHDSVAFSRLVSRFPPSTSRAGYSQQV